MNPDDTDLAASTAGDLSRAAAARSAPVARVEIRRRASFTATRWKNGGGVTHEAIRVPASGDRFRWRVSVAEIAASGPFSDFTGYQRKMVLLAGSGLRLHFQDGGRSELRRPGDLVEFDGAQAVQCELIAGPCADLNLIAANGVEVEEVCVERLASPLVLCRREGQTALIFAVGGGAIVESEAAEPAELGPWDLAVLSGCAGTALVRAGAVQASGAAVFLAKLSYC